MWYVPTNPVAQLIDAKRADKTRITPPGEARPFGGEVTPYAHAALMAESERVREATEGTRNDALNRASFALATLVADGEIDQEGVEAVLTDAAREAGLPDSEIRKTLASGIRSGLQHPRGRGEDIWESGSGSSAKPPDTNGTGKDSGTAPSTTSSRAAKGAAESSREPLVVYADKRKMRRTHWGWRDHDGHGRMPMGQLSLAAGRESTGKSSFGLWLAAHMSKGELRGEFWGTPHNVLYSAVEDSWEHTLVPRLVAAEADLSRVASFNVKTKYSDDALTVSLPDDFSALERAIVSENAKLVILDPLMSMIDGSLDSHRNREVRSVLEPLNTLAERTGALILGIAHFNKSTTGDPATLITGSGAFKDVPRALFGFARDEEGRVMTQVKNSLGNDQLPSLDYRTVTRKVSMPDGGPDEDVVAFEFIGHSIRTVEQVLANNGSGFVDSQVHSEAADWLKAYLVDQGGEARVNDLFKAGRVDGLSADQLRRAKAQLGAKAEKRGVVPAGYWVWELP
jgi:hypothetical protein